MKIEAQSVQEYLENLPDERKEPIEKLRKISKTLFAAQTSNHLLNGLVNISQRTIKPNGMSSGLEKPISSGSCSFRLNHSLIGG